MSKPMLVTVPFLLLLLDYWPLDRFRTAAGTSPRAESSGWLGRLPVGWRLVVEKIPLMALAAVSCWIALSTHATIAANGRVEQLTLAHALANALVSYAAYVGQSFYPVNLAPFYPHPGTRLPIVWAAASLVLLVAITAVAAYCWRRGLICWSAGFGFWECWCRSSDWWGLVTHGQGRPLHLSEPDWFVDRAGLGRVERLSVATISAGGALAGLDAGGRVGRGGARCLPPSRGVKPPTGAMMRRSGRISFLHRAKRDGSL